MADEIYNFLQRKVCSKYIVLKILCLSENGYFYNYIDYFSFINEEIIEEIILSKKADKIHFIFENFELFLEKFMIDLPENLKTYFKNTNKSDFWNQYLINLSSTTSIDFWFMNENFKSIEKFLSKNQSFADFYLDMYFSGGEVCDCEECCDPNRYIYDNIKNYPNQSIIYFIDQKIISLEKLQSYAKQEKNKRLLEIKKIKTF